MEVMVKLMSMMMVRTTRRGFVWSMAIIRKAFYMINSSDIYNYSQ